MSKIRIATVTATGKRYIVNQLSIGVSVETTKVHCWGEVVEVRQKGRALQTRHEDQKTFMRPAVEIVEVERTPQLLRELFDQRLEGLRAKGHVLEDRTTRRGNRRVTDHGTPQQQAERRRLNEQILGELLPVLDMVERSRRPVYREPSVTQGPDMPIPETRADVLERIVERLTTKGAFLQRYSSGEITDSSIAVGLTFEDCKRVEVLEVPGYTVHYDKALGLYWRRGGSWD